MGDYAVIFATSGDYRVIPNGLAHRFEPLPDKAIRASITELNNFFIVPKSRSLRLDVQYFGGVYSNTALTPDVTCERHDPIGEILSLVIDDV